MAVWLYFVRLRNRCLNDVHSKTPYSSCKFLLLAKTEYASEKSYAVGKSIGRRHTPGTGVRCQNLVRNGHADHVARRPLSGAKRKTYARIELFRFWPQTDMPWQGGDGAVKGRTDVQREPGRLRFDLSRPPTVGSVFSFGPLGKLVRGPWTESS